MLSFLFNTLKLGIKDGVCEKIGYPSIVNRAIRDNQNIKCAYKIPPRSAGISNSHKWSTQIGHLPSSNSRFILTQQTNYSFDFREFNTSEKDKLWVVKAHSNYDLRDLIVYEKDDNFVCDIKDIEGLYASKSNLNNYKNLDYFAVHGTYKFLDDISKTNFYKLLEHTEIRIIHTSGADCFIKDEWDGRLILGNSGGSHHFAAAHFIAKKLNIDFELKGRLDKYSYNKKFLMNLINDFEIFTINYDEVFGEFYQSLRAYKASFALMPFPGLVERQFIILFPKSVKESMEVSQLLKNSGFNDFKYHINKIITGTITSI